MAISSSQSKTRNCHVRSTSFPSRSHPTILKIVGQISKIKSSDAAASTSSGPTGLLGLEDLYVALEELLSLRSTQQVLSCRCKSQQEGFIDEMLDGSVQLLDVCGNTKETLLQIQDSVRALQSALRRKKGDLGLKPTVDDYMNLRKKTKRNAKKLIAALKKMDIPLSEDCPVGTDEGQHLSSVIRVLREVNVLSSCIFQSLLSFLSMPVSKPNMKSKWSLVSKLVHKGDVACEDHNKREDVNDLGCVDSGLLALCKQLSSREGVDGEKLQTAQGHLMKLEMGIEAIVVALQDLYRRLIRTRASLLNICSQ